MTRRGGFTLLEVLIAVFVLATAMGALLVFVTGNLAAIASARQRAEAMSLAEQRLRELTSDPGAGSVLEVGTTDGSFEESDPLRWELTVEPYGIPLPEELSFARELSTLFLEPSPNSRAPQPSLRRVVLRVFAEDEGPEASQPFVAFAVTSAGVAEPASRPASQPVSPASEAAAEGEP